ncbi:MAG: hypothetical protein H6850_01485 [Alphaproteobacteria bacterium]|nr:MAG: hypothetical protein H6850_01485 [Alphaproteobacteria bacterium]
MDWITLALETAKFFTKHFPGLLQTKDPLELSRILKEHPDKALELYKHLMTLEQEMHKMVLIDRQKARLTNKSFYRRFLFFSFVCLGLGGCFWLMQKPNLSSEILVIISTLAGILGSCLKDIYAFEFGGDAPKRSIKPPGF